MLHMYECLSLLSDSCGDVWIDLDTGNTTYLTSPSYPELYSPNTHCVWYFTAADLHGTFVVRYLDVYLISYDVLSVGQSHNLSVENTINRLSLWFAPVSAAVHHQHMWIQFESNEDSVVYIGFFLQVERLDTSGEC